MRGSSLILALFFLLSSAQCSQKGGIGTSVFVVERESGYISVVDYAALEVVDRFSTAGNLRHASMVFSPDLRFGYIIARDGVLSKISLEKRSEADSLKISENSIALAISQDGRFLAAANYKPGGITIVDLQAFRVIQEIPAKSTVDGREITSRVTGLVDAPGNQFICSLMDSDEIWVIGPSEKDAGAFRVKKSVRASAKNPFDALLTPDGRYYMAGHFKQDRVSLVDMWSDSNLAKPVYFYQGERKSGVPVKMPHMEGWAVGDDRIFIPVTSDNRLYSISFPDFKPSGHVDLIGNPVYAVVRPDKKEIWVTFSGDEFDGKIQIIDLQTMKSSALLEAGKRIYHLAFTPRGDRVIISSNESNEVVIMDAMNRTVLKRLSVSSPSGIFGVWRAFQTGL